MTDRAHRARELPSGPVTFLFTDIEGSTRLLQSLGERYPKLLETHHRLLGDAIAANRGLVVNTEGDAFFAVFTTPEDAIAAAATAQRELEAQTWPDDRRVRVRMGLHAGTGTLAGTDYTGLDVHRAARIAGAAHGGQVLLSQATVERAAGRLPAGVGTRELGPHRLKDLPDAEHVHQLAIDGLPDAFPPLAGGGERRGNLPMQLSSFVGRGRLLGELEELVLRSRLVTLTGPGGTGKTTLAVRCGSNLLPRITDGVYVAALAAISDPALVLPAVIQDLPIEDNPSRRPIDLLVEHLARQDVLLILDNLEQVLEVGAEVRELLERTERLRILVTSREPLGVQGELQVSIPPMDVPDVGQLPDINLLSRVEAVELFVDRAAAVRPGFALGADNARAIAEICARLDGLPLAIELAAARVKILSPQQILERLARRLPLLAREARDVPARQRTLRDTIAWSHDLLEEGQRVLFRRLAAFEGGFTLAAAEAIDVDGPGDTFEDLAALVNKSLVRHVESGRHEVRFLMLETIREFGSEELERAGEREAIERRHLEHFVALAQAAEPELTGGRGAQFLDQLAADHDNLRRAIERASARGWVARGLRLGTALWRFWQMRGHLREGRERLAALTLLPGADATPREFSRAISALGSIAYWMADFETAEAQYRRALELARASGDARGVAEETYNLAFAVNFLGDAAGATALLREAEAAFRGLDDRPGEAKAVWGRAGFSPELDALGRLELSERALRIFRELGDRFHEGWAHRTAGLISLERGDFDQARARIADGLKIFKEAGDVSAMAVFIGLFADLAAQEGDVRRAVTLGGAAAAARESTATGLADWVSGSDERAALVTRAETDAAAARFWADGQAMSLDHAVAYALKEPGHAKE